MAHDHKEANIAGPLDLRGPAVTRDSHVREHNNAPKADENVWLQNMRSQDAELSKAEVEFFSELKKRAGDAI